MMAGAPVAPRPAMSAIPEYLQAQQGNAAKLKKTHRGRRSKGKGPLTAAAHHAEAKTHLAAAQAAPTAPAATAHLFKALTSLNAAKAAAAQGAPPAAAGPAGM